VGDIEVERAQQLLDLGRYDDALRAVTPVLARDPGDAQAHLVAGWATRGLDRPEDAWDHARAAAEAAPDDGESLALMALCDLETGDPARRDRARALGRRAVAVEPWNPVTHVALVHSLLDDPAANVEARSAADRALRQFPENALFLTLAAKSRLVTGTGTVEAWDQEAARALLEDALRLEPTHREARHLLGALDDAWGRGRRSLRGLAAVLAEDPTSEVAHASLRAWLLGTATTWSIGLGVATLTELWSLLADPPGATTFATGLGWVALAAVLVRVTSAHLASGGATTRAATRDPQVRWATTAPVAAAVLLAVGPLLGTLAVPAVAVAGGLLVWGAVNGARA
jgi:hypothetical protein